jgi:hypothetical protein
MNLTDLTTELQTRAADPAPAVAMNRLTGVRHRIQVRRRRQMASAAGLTALAVAAVILFPGMSQQRAERLPAPPATAVPTPAPSDPLEFAASESGAMLIGSAYGTGDLVLGFTPQDTNLSVSMFCRLPPGWDGPFLTAGLYAGNDPMFWQRCEEGRAPNQTVFGLSTSGAQNREDWASRGVHPGSEKELHFRLTLEAPEDESQPGTETPSAAQIPPGIQLGVGVYQLDAPQLTSDGVTWPQMVLADGNEYTLTRNKTTVVTATSRRLKLTAPRGEKPVLVMWGLLQTTEQRQPSGQVRLYVDGTLEGQPLDSGSFETADLEDPLAHKLELRVPPKLRGTMAIAYYVRTD